MENIETKMSSYEGQISRGTPYMTAISVQFLNFEHFKTVTSACLKQY